MTQECFILARAVHFGACLLFFGLFAFDRWVAVSVISRGQSETANYWKAHVQRFSLLLLAFIFLSGIGWFLMVATTMSGQPIQLEIVKTVWTQTQFGTVWKIRLMVWLAATLCAGLNFLKLKNSVRESLSWIQLFFSGALLGGLVWAGHGQESSRWHLYADVLHLLVAGIWPAGLLPFALMLRQLRGGSRPADQPAIATLVRRFSALSLGSVAVLTVTGFINSWFLVGSFSNLFQQPYGRWLLAKIILLIFAVAIGAINLLRLKPRLLMGNSPAHNIEATAAQLQFNVRLELFLATAIVVIVGVLGILPPAVH